MVDTRIKISSIVANQLPIFVREEFPLVSEFLTQYYSSLESQGSTLDIIQNIDKYVKIDNLTNLVTSTTLTEDVDFFDDTIFVSSTYGFPQSYGLIQIDSEIITYTGITTNSFTGCVRGFSGTTSYKDSNKPDQLVFSESEAATHTTNTTVNNLSILFLQEFFKKVKTQITPGFENREFYSGVDERLFIKQSKDFYSSKGADQSFEILFRALYGEDVQVIKPRDYLFMPSDAQYRVTKDIVVEALEGNPEDLLNRTLFQDQTDQFSYASGSITDVQKIQRNGKEYYILSLDYDYDKDIAVRGSIFGKFAIHPTTKLITTVSAGSSTLDVDSTVGFPTSGTLIASYSDGTSSTITYESKSLNQFFGCSGIDRTINSSQDLRLDAYAYGYAGLSTSNVVKVRITGVLSELDFSPFTFYCESGDIIESKYLGIGLTTSAANNWLFNISTSYEIKSLTLQNNVNFSYNVTTFDPHSFVVGDTAKILASDGTERTCAIINILNQYTFTIKDQGQLNLQRSYTIQKLLSKVNSNNQELSIYTTNVQNVYTDKESLYVASPSIPTYLDQPLEINNRSVTFSGSFNGENITIPNHGFYTGDSITYSPISDTNTLGISSGIYFIKKVDNNTLKLSKSKANIFNEKYVSVSGTVTNNVFEYTIFSDQNLQPQKLIRKISNPISDGSDYETTPGFTGILVNGVEILNYKSNDSIFYGSIQKIDVTSEGSGYDIINPPILEVSDPVGTGLSSYCEVEGRLERIEIIDGGFDYVDTPTISIVGGNGKGAVATPNLISIDHSVQFNSEATAGLVDLTNNTVAFSTHHKFRDGELVIYKTDGQTSVGGLSTNSIYYVSIQDEFTVKFHKTYSDAISRLNVIDLTSYGVGNHIVVCANKKNIIGSISIINPGFGYKNRKVSVTSSGINTASNTITIKNHKFNSGEVISYTPGSSAIGGLNSGNYYVTKIDDDNFKLSEIGIGSTDQDFFYKNQQYVKLNSTGSGTQTFNYPNIQVNIKGTVGVSTLSGQNFNAILQPIFRGEIKSVFIEDGGVGYGSSEILNYNRQPLFTLNSGSGAQLNPVVSDGKITNVIVLNSGSGYNCPPDIQINGSGKGAILTPVISNGAIVDVKIVSGGVGYINADTTISVISAGSGAKFESTSKKWTVNNFERLLINNQITNDDGVISKGTNSTFGLQYSHLYSPRKLRQSIFATKVVNGQITYTPDLQLQNGREILSDSHSPIIGWAYDGNPIYGPYGYTSLTGGSVRLMKSGYELSIASDRPNPISSTGDQLYPEGFFVEDYQYDKNGDLDEYNGRFCITPEFPNGIYAYFTTINPNSIESNSPFKNYRKPQFPYFIGNKFKSKPIDYNFDRYSNQDDVNLQTNGFIRNTTPYNFDKDKSSYNFVVDPNKIQKQNTEIVATGYGEIQSVGIITGGSNYSVGDVIIFDNTDTQGTGAEAKISAISGKEINNINIDSSIIYNVEFVPYASESTFIGFSTDVHNLKNFDTVSISGLSTAGTNLQSFFAVGVSTSSYILSNDILPVSVTGIITYFNVYGNLNYPNIRENDILGIGTEKVRVLNIDTVSSRIRVERGYDNTVGSSHTASSILTEFPRKFVINAKLISNPYQYSFTRELYFDPKDTVGLGTQSGVGIGYTITFSNPGVGETQIFVPTKSLYIPNHNLSTGDELIYNSNGGSRLSVSTDGISNFQLVNGQTVYAAKISNDLVGISTFRVGLGSTGSFVGINSSITTSTLYFTGIGTGLNHSFTTNSQNILKGTVQKNYVTVSTASSHGLELYDRVFLKSFTSGISTTVVVQYNDYNRRLVLDPRSFISSDVDIVENTITISNHKLTTGQKVIYNSSSPSIGLSNNSIYYVYVIDDNKIKLCSSITNATLPNPISVDIGSASSGSISKVNPPIAIEKGQTILFDLSNSSLSFVSNSIRYSAFDFNIYYDPNCKYPFYSSSFNNVFEVEKNGEVGIDTNAYLKLKVTETLPKNLYYNLEPINLGENSVEKLQIFKDSENIKNNNSLVVINNPLEGSHTVSGVGSTTFSFNILNKPSKNNYTSTDGQFSYFTNSETAYGSIFSVELTSKGRNYKKLPGISSISSIYGSGSILLPQSNTIGKILKVNIQDIGFDYPVDNTLRPESQIPQVMRIEPYYTFNRIGISSVGVNYLKAPNLVVVDGLTNKQILDVNLKYNLGDSEVTILKNTKSISNKTPKIIPINNVNGITISSISFNNTTKDVTVSLGASFSSLSDFPFEVGEKVIIENISVGIVSTGKGYNSSNYEYSLFTITQVNFVPGGTTSSITYNLLDYLSEGEVPGNYDPINSSGKVTPSKYFPIFDISLTSNEFLNREFLTSNSARGVVNSWDSKNGYLKVSSIQNFNPGDIIIGESSDSQGLIVEVNRFDSHYKIDSSSIVKKGWNKETGFLNNGQQRLHDNDYYQYFSYSLKSKVQYHEWNDPVSSLNHTAGFKKFGDLNIESRDLKNVGINTDQNLGDFVGIADLISEMDLNCVYDFDLATERTIEIDSKIYSNEIVFKSKTIQDYIESIGNRVLIIDDISDQFNSNPRASQFSSVDLFYLSSARSKKYITYVVDKRFSAERQILLVSLLHNDSTGFLNQYGRVETVGDLGSFDFSIFGAEGQLLFYPTKYQVNDYYVNSVAYNLEDTISGIGTLDLGDTVKISSSTTTIPAGSNSPSTIVGIASTYRSSKILVQYGAVDNSYFEYDELTVIHNGTEVELLEYGQLSTDTLTSSGSLGLGTYSAYLSGSNLNIDFTPNVGLGVTYNVNTIRISLSDTSSVGVSTSVLNTSILDSRITSIASSASPSATVVAQYQKPYSCAYYVVSIEDLTNNQYQISEVVIADDGTTASLTEFGILQTGSNLGNFDAAILGDITQLTFTPIPNSNIQIRVFQNALRLINSFSNDTFIDLNNASIETGYGTYLGTETDIKREFYLTYKQLPLFKRSFAGNDTNIIDLVNNLIVIPNHFFVTGEKLTYSYVVNPDEVTQAIGIVTTTISGIGVTNKLPSTVYAIKVDESSIRLAESPENALKESPVPLILSSVGVGSSHSFVSNNQNSRVLVSIDNVIQSPIVSTAITTKLSDQILITDDTIKVSGITSFFGGDLIKINDEIMRIDSVGFGSTNVFLVKRPWMGTGISSHSSGSLVTKVDGNYNIVDNSINFITAPYGKTPIGTTSGSPDNFDFVGVSTYSTFSGRSFLRSGITGTTEDPYSKNYIFDDISNNFTGYSTSFTLTSNRNNITGISTDNAIILVNQIFQGPQRLGVIDIQGDYTLKENVGITSIQFTGNISSTSYDINTASVPLGGVIVSVASSEGFGYQPLVSAGGTAIISGLGTVSSISIGNSGSGYRSGLQVVRVGVQTVGLNTTNITYVGIASVSNGNVVSIAITNPGSGFTSSNPPQVIFDAPLSYSNLPLIYSNSSVSGFGTGAKVNVVVGQGSSVIDFEITNLGYGYGQGEILTIGIGGTVGIPTNTSLPYKEFQIIIDRTYSDSFSGWTIGNLLLLDPIDSLFDGRTVSFPLTVEGQQKTIRAKTGSLIDVQATLLVFINDILQVPGQGYIFDGGSFITFTEAPKVGDTSKILFYQGTSSVDVVDVDILETVKVGDDVRLNDDNIQYKEDDRIVTKINASDSIDTNVYPGPGITLDENYTRPLIWCRQTQDKFIDGKSVTKDRILYEPLIYPNTKIIQSVGVGSTVIFVESVKTFFDSVKENSTVQNKIRIISQDSVVSASATAIVSAGGTISSISITNGGIGYTVAPSVTIANPVGLGSTQNATAVSSITSGIVTSISITSPGFGYIASNPPVVLIEEPKISGYTEEISDITYSGDFGIISGISTSSTGIASTALVFDLVISKNSFLRDASIVGTAITVSGIQTGYYFVVFNSNVGNGVTSLRSNGSIVSIGSSYLDNVYEVSSVSIAQTGVPGFGVTYVAKVTVSVQNYNGLTGIGFSSFFGEYSWGRISAPSRKNAKQFTSYNNGLVGISTSPIVERYNPLKYLNYT